MLNVTVDNTAALAGIEQRLRKLRDPDPVLWNIGRFSRALTFQMFNGRRPDTTVVRGEKWNPLKITTLAQKRALLKKGQALVADRPLVRSGKLRDSLMSDRSIQVRSKGMSYGTDVRDARGYPYPAIHQTGSGYVPKRRFLFWTDADLQQILKMAIDHIENKLLDFNAYVRRS